MVSVAQLKDVPTSPSLRPDIAELRSRVAQIAPQIKARAHTTEKAGAFRKRTSRHCAT